MSKPRILVVADDAPLRGTLARWLMAAGYAVELAESPKRAREVVAGGEIALGILAPDGLGEEGVVLASELRSAFGRLLMVAQPNGGGETTALQASGEITRPLNHEEVLALVKAALPPPQVVEEPATGPELLRFEDFTIDAAARTCVRADGSAVGLTRAEFSLLLAMARQPGRVVSRDQLRRAVAGRGAEPDDRSIDVLMSRLRRKIEPDPKEPRFIITLPGEGYRLAAALAPDVASVPIAPAPVAAAPAVPPPAAPAPSSPVLPPPPTPRIWLGRRAQIGSAAVALAAVLGLLVWYLRPGARIVVPPTQTFDAAVIPLVSDAQRVELAGYTERADSKALAISTEAFGLASGARDQQTANADALARCVERTNNAIRHCQIYASGTTVVWSPAMLPLPLPADIHAEPLDASLDLEFALWNDVSRTKIKDDYLQKAAPHKALAISASATDTFWVFGFSGAAEAARLATERCTDFNQMACLLMSVDGNQTVRVPRVHPATAIFMLSTEAQMSPSDRQRIAEVYGQKDWRALARGRSGNWYPVANAESEEKAAAAALADCSAHDGECRLYAISNFRVRDEK